MPPFKVLWPSLRFHVEVIKFEAFICISEMLQITKGQNKTVLSWKLDGVGPVDNRPSTNKLHHFVRKKKTCDT